MTQTLLSIPNVLAKHSVSVLIRGEEKVPVFEKMGVKPILFNSLEETEFLRKIASGHDSKSAICMKARGNSWTDAISYHLFGLWL